MLHGMPAVDPKYAELRGNVANALKGSYLYPDYKHQWEERSKYPNDGEEQFFNGWVDGAIRNMLWRGTPEEAKRSRYLNENEVLDEYYRDPAVLFNQKRLEHYLRTHNAK
jgi:hypothetical protein